ncbi:hypothetical protein [Salinivibrio phage SMHB1]|uniref:Uncharacterized protein n=1 Tax=Salinivibrio phage SMHB1 TaxID=1897436 RepID=A0A1D9C9R6_9CAUD|nr:hypothetical protein HOR26_gp36 [Salinivibrio phage SMHB1]AOY11841.1 hypothetical protein [Salinivibrio phage SMHB1]
MQAALKPNSPKWRWNGNWQPRPVRKTNTRTAKRIALIAARKSPPHCEPPSNTSLFASSAQPMQKNERG